MKNVYYKYYKINSCYERENKETKDPEVVVVWNEIKTKWTMSQYPKWFVYSPEDFVAKFWSKIKKDEYNKWLTGLILRGEVDFQIKNEEITEDLPDDLK